MTEMDGQTHDHKDHECCHGHVTKTDPVCGMEVEVKTAEHIHDHDGESYYFCSAHCREAFVADPSQYLEATGGDKHGGTPSAQDEAIYTCPMHPEVRQEGPGSCPDCGMALEPRSVQAEEEANPELVDMTRRFWVSAVLTLPVFVLAMSEMLPGQPVHSVLSERAMIWF